MLGQFAATRDRRCEVDGYDRMFGNEERFVAEIFDFASNRGDVAGLSGRRDHDAYFHRTLRY